MKNLSLKLKDEIYKETEKITAELKMPRNAYINQAVDFYNKLRKRALLKKIFERDSKLARESSMEMLEMLEQLDDDFEAA